MKRASAEHRRMAQNLLTACELTAAGEAMLRQRLRRERPRASREEIDAEVVRWFQTRPGAEAGDAVGRLVPWPRPRKTRSSRR